MYLLLYINGDVMQNEHISGQFQTALSMHLIYSWLGNLSYC